MAWSDKFLAIFRSEAKDVKEGLDGLKDKLDVELTKRETEMAATPAERMEMIKDDIKSGDSRLDEIGEEIAADQAVSKARADMADPAQAASGTGERLEDRLERTSGQTPDEAISEAISDAHAQPETPAEPQLSVQEKADATLDELRDELGLDPGDSGPSASTD